MLAKERQPMKLKANPGALFTTVILLLMLGLVMSAKQWQYQARLFPWAIGIPTLLLCFLQLGLDLFKTQGDKDPAGMMDLPVDRSVPVAVVIKRAVNIFSWIFGLYLSIWLIGFIISVPLFLLLYLSIQARESWNVIITYTIVMFVFLIGVFEMVLHIPWPPGIFDGPQAFILSLVERYLSGLVPV